MDKDILKYYRKKMKDSFNTKLNVFVFSQCVKGALEKITISDFAKYEINDEDITHYAAVYYQLPLNDQINSISIAQISLSIEKWKMLANDLISQMKVEYQNHFERIFPYEDFKKLVCIDECHYCGISLSDINNLINKRLIFKKHEARGFSMEIDRISPNQEYSKENSVICCYWCNNAKTDEFSGEEFRSIAKGIREIWVKRGVERLRKS